jgi:hypothetical protein
MGCQTSKGTPAVPHLDAGVLHHAGHLLDIVAEVSRAETELERTELGRECCPKSVETYDVGLLLLT